MNGFYEDKNIDYGKRKEIRLFVAVRVSGQKMIKGLLLLVLLFIILQIVLVQKNNKRNHKTILACKK